MAEIYLHHRDEQTVTMPLHLPADGNPTKDRASSVITLLPGKNNSIYYYEVLDPKTGITPYETQLLNRPHGTINTF